VTATPLPRWSIRASVSASVSASIAVRCQSAQHYTGFPDSESSGHAMAAACNALPHIQRIPDQGLGDEERVPWSACGLAIDA
jgi:hypothetical protein